jgi:hypothetical protein
MAIDQSCIVKARKSTLRDIFKCRAIQITFANATQNARWDFVLGFWLYGADVWLGNVPLLKTMIAANFIILWLLFSFFR